jgi:hypothetical protein
LATRRAGHPRHRIGAGYARGLHSLVAVVVGSCVAS